jgi:large subunit ribosomal protein L29
MNTADLRKKSSEELQTLLLELNREQFNLRMQQGTGQLSKPSQLKSVRRNIARIKTIMTELQLSKN